MYEYHNTMALWRNVYTSSAILTVWYHLLEKSAFMVSLYRRQQKTYLGFQVKCLLYIYEIWNF